MFVYVFLAISLLVTAYAVKGVKEQLTKKKNVYTAMKTESYEQKFTPVVLGMIGITLFCILLIPLTVYNHNEESLFYICLFVTFTLFLSLSYCLNW
jgi:hypothetical protein